MKLLLIAAGCVRLVASASRQSLLARGLKSVRKRLCASLVGASRAGVRKALVSPPCLPSSRRFGIGSPTEAVTDFYLAFHNGGGPTNYIPSMPHPLARLLFTLAVSVLTG